MSQALFEQVVGNKHTAASPGTQPAEHLHPEVSEVMAEKGIDLSGHNRTYSQPNWLKPQTW